MKKTLLLFVLIITLFSFTVNAKGILENGNNIYSDYVYMVNLDTGKVVYEYEPNTVTYPASLTKIMTCILAIENIESLEDTVVIPSGIFNDIYAQGGVHMSLKAGEEISVGDLIRATMIRSTCDSASAIAWHVSGSIENFAQLMNEKAKEIGCTSTHFVNAHGLHDENHYTTAKDMYLIANYALQNKTFCDIINEYSCSIASTNKSDAREFLSTIEIEIPENENYCEYITGVKSGFTDEAGRCLITKGSKDGENYLLVTLGANRDKWYNSNMAFTDAVTLFEYCFAEYGINTVISSVNPLTEIEVIKGEKERISLFPEKDITALTALNDKAKITFNLPEKVSAPIKENEVLGTFTVSILDEEYTGNLISKESVARSDAKKGLSKLNNGSTVATMLDISALIIFIISTAILIIFVLKIKKHKRK